jgi:hypothetical protein
MSRVEHALLTRTEELDDAVFGLEAALRQFASAVQ